jgi:hypothetical protein
MSPLQDLQNHTQTDKGGGSGDDGDIFHVSSKRIDLESGYGNAEKIESETLGLTYKPKKKKNNGTIVPHKFLRKRTQS